VRGRASAVADSPQQTGIVVLQGSTTPGDRALPLGPLVVHPGWRSLCAFLFGHTRVTPGTLRTAGNPLCRPGGYHKLGPRPAFLMLTCVASTLGLISRRPPAGPIRSRQARVLDALRSSGRCSKQQPHARTAAAKVCQQPFGLWPTRLATHNRGDAPAGESGPLQEPAGARPAPVRAMTGQMGPASPAARASADRGVGQHAGQSSRQGHQGQALADGGAPMANSNPGAPRQSRAGQLPSQPRSRVRRRVRLQDCGQQTQHGCPAPAGWRQVELTRLQRNGWQSTTNPNGCPLLASPWRQPRGPWPAVLPAPTSQAQIGVGRRKAGQALALTHEPQFHAQARSSTPWPGRSSPVPASARARSLLNQAGQSPGLFKGRLFCFSSSVHHGIVHQDGGPGGFIFESV